MSIRSVACQVHETVSIQLANPLGTESVSLFSYFSITTLDDLGRNRGKAEFTIQATCVTFSQHSPRDAKNHDIRHVRSDSVCHSGNCTLLMM